MNWDQYYLDVCNTIASKSNCLSRKVGAILVRDKTIVSTGYNNPPREIPHCGQQRYFKDSRLRTAIGRLYPSKEELNATCPRRLLGFKSGEGLGWCTAAHGETNCIVEAGRQGVQTKGCRMYMNCAIPCGECMKLIINAGIEEIIVTEEEYYDDMSYFLLLNSNVKWRTYDNN